MGSVPIATSYRDALRGCLVRGVAHTRGKRHSSRQRLAYSRETNVDADGLRGHVLVRAALGLDIVRGGGEIGGCTTMSNDELAQAGDLLS